MLKIYNAHPKGLRVGDCVKRAICTVEDRDYMEVGRELNRIKREIGADAYNSNEVWKKYVEDKGYIKHSFPAVKGQKRMNGKSFMKAYPKGKYILRMAGHLTCCIDGHIYDTWDCTDKCVYNAFELPQK